MLFGERKPTGRRLTAGRNGPSGARSILLHLPHTLIAPAPATSDGSVRLPCSCPRSLKPKLTLEGRVTSKAPLNPTGVIAGISFDC